MEAKITLEVVTPKLSEEEKRILQGVWVATLNKDTYRLRFDYNELLEGWQGQYNRIDFLAAPAPNNQIQQEVAWTTMRSVEYDPNTGILVWTHKSGTGLGEVRAVVIHAGMASGKWSWKWDFTPNGTAPKVHFFMMHR